MKRSALLVALPFVVATALSIESLAHAQGDPGRADTLYKEAVELFKSGNVKGACAKLDESFNLDPKTQTLFSLAKCRQREGRVATAWLQFNELIKRGEREGDAAKLAEYKAKAAEVDRLVPRATLKLENRPEVTEVRLDGKPIPRAEWSAPVPMDPGDHVFHFAGTGKLETEKHVTVRESETLTIEIDPLQDAGGAGGAGGAGAGGAVSTKDGSSPTLGYILGGVGIAGLAVGTITGIVAINNKSTADDLFDRRDPGFKDKDDAASSMALVSTISFVVGIIGVGAGTYLVLTHDSKKSAQAPSRFTFGASTDRIVIGGRF
jgi:hypothetical protein